MEEEMRTIAFIPLRGGSKSIPLKNIKTIAGKPLCHWVIEAALNTKLIDEVFVSTDSEQIKESVEKIKSPKLKIINRSIATATDTASTESALIEFLQNHSMSQVILIQATSPLLESHDLQNGIEQFRQGKFDSLLSVVRQKRFLWKEETSGAIAINYKPDCRPRRQDFEGFLVENGAFYISSKDAILKTGCRLSGKIGLYEMSEESYIELDEPLDWSVIENMLLMRKSSLATERIKKISHVFTDVDGVLTDAGMYYSEKGDELKKFNTRDGMGFNLLTKAGIKTGILTSENTQMVERRGEKLKIDYVFQSVKNKLEFLDEFCKKNQLTLEQIAYIGDDINDTELLKRVGLPACPFNAIDDNKSITYFHCQLNGGEGCFREFVEYILRHR